MNVFFYTGLKILEKGFEDKHITTMFSPFVGKGAFSTTSKSDNAVITKIEYWENSGVIVALVDCPLAFERYHFFSSLGYVYDYEYKPHITLEYSNKNLVDKYSHLIGKKLKVGNEYFKPFYKK